MYMQKLYKSLNIIKLRSENSIMVYIYTYTSKIETLKKEGLMMMMPATVTSTSGKIIKQDNDACRKIDHT